MPTGALDVDTGKLVLSAIARGQRGGRRHDRGHGPTTPPLRAWRILSCAPRRVRVLQPPCSTYSSIAALVTSVRPTSFKEAAVRAVDSWGVRVESGSPKLRFVRTTT